MHSIPAAAQNAAVDTPRFPVEDTIAPWKPRLRATLTVTVT